MPKDGKIDGRWLTMPAKLHTYSVSLSVLLFLPIVLSYFKIQNDSILFKFQRAQTKYIERLAKLNKYCEGS